MEFFNEENDLCGLCGNHGVIDTMGKVYSPAGYHAGIIAFCICPNGRGMKKRASTFGRSELEGALRPSGDFAPSADNLAAQPMGS